MQDLYRLLPLIKNDDKNNYIFIPTVNQEILSKK
jgi:hypothetical protein